MLGAGELFRFSHMHRVVIYLRSPSHSTESAVPTSSIACTLSSSWPAYRVETFTQHVFRRIQSTVFLQVGFSGGTCSEYDGFLQQHLFSLRVALIDWQGSNRFEAPVALSWSRTVGYGPQQNEKEHKMVSTRAKASHRVLHASLS